MAREHPRSDSAEEPTGVAWKGGAISDLAVCLAAYLYGSLPLVYLLGRRAGADLRTVGSGNVGASNLWAARGAVPGLAGWLFDASKGLLPIVVARRLGYRDEVARLAGVCGVAGQCWPAWPGVGGGRGISAFVGASFMMDRVAWALSMSALSGGGLWRVAALWRRGKDDLEDQLRSTRGKAMPLGCFIGVVLFPIFVRLHEQGWLNARRTIQPTTAGPWFAIRPQSIGEGTSKETLPFKAGSTSWRAKRWALARLVIHTRSRLKPAAGRDMTYSPDSSPGFPGGGALPAGQSQASRAPNLAPALLSLVILLRRLTAPLPDDATYGPSRRRAALLYRLLYDRNTNR